MELVKSPCNLEMPKRTALASLCPVGLGTPWVESLSSYFQRLADHHGVSPKLLARELVLPRMHLSNRTSGIQADRYWRSSFFSGMGETPERWCRILESLTGVPGLHRLTLLPLHGLIGLRGCSSPTRRWCPHCIHESEAQGHPYGQLLWEIGCVKVCPKHGVPLVSTHGCAAEDAIPALRLKPLPHLCGKCGRSLAIPPPATSSPCDAYELSFAEAIGEILHGSRYGVHLLPPQRTIADFLSDVIQSSGGCSGVVAARRIGVSKSEASLWVRRQHLPSLPHAFLIAQAYGVELDLALVGEGGRYYQVARSTTYRPRPITFRTFNRTRGVGFGNLEPQLRPLLTLPIPPSEAAAAKMVGTSSRELRRRYPELAQALAERHAAWRKQEATRRHQERLGVIEELVNQMVSEGVIPSIARLGERLVGIPKTFLFQERRACKRLCDKAKGKLGVGATR